MNFLQALTSFIAAQFPGWGCCHLSLGDDRTLYIHPRTVRNYLAVVADRDRLAQLDIGIEQFVIEHVDYPATTISTVRHSSI